MTDGFKIQWSSFLLHYFWLVYFISTFYSNRLIY